MKRVLIALIANACIAAFNFALYITGTTPFPAATLAAAVAATLTTGLLLGVILWSHRD